jgi:DHA1 family multidrug resistance protein-like MFS transporter
VTPGQDATARPPAPSWKLLLTLFTVAGFVEAVFWGHVGAFMPLHLPHLGVPQQEISRWTGLSVALTSAVGIPFLPLWGALADRYTRQPIIVRSFAAHLLAAILMMLAGNLWIFLVGRAVMSFSLGNTGLMMTTLSERAPLRRVAFAFSILNAAAPVGVFLGPLLGGPVVDAWGFRRLLMLDVIVLAGVIAALTLGYRDPFSPSERRSVVHMAWESIRIIGRSKRLVTLFLTLFVLFAGWLLAFTYVPLAIAALYRGRELGTAVGAVLGAGGLTTLVMSPPVGALADRVGYWRVLIGGTVVTILLWPLPALAPDLLTFGVAWALVNGVTSSVFAVSFSALSSSAPNEMRGRVMSFAYLPINAGLILGPAIGSLVTRSSVFAVFPLAAVLTAIGLGGLLVAARQAQPQIA